MPLSNIVRKLAPRGQQVVYNMVWVLHDALEIGIPIPDPFSQSRDSGLGNF